MSNERKQKILEVKIFPECPDPECHGVLIPVLIEIMEEEEQQEGKQNRSRTIKIVWKCTECPKVVEI